MTYVFSNIYVNKNRKLKTMLFYIDIVFNFMHSYFNVRCSSGEKTESPIKFFILSDIFLSDSTQIQILSFAFFIIMHATKPYISCFQISNPDIKYKDFKKFINSLASLALVEYFMYRLSQLKVLCLINNRTNAILSVCQLFLFWIDETLT